MAHMVGSVTLDARHSPQNAGILIWDGTPKKAALILGNLKP